MSPKLNFGLLGDLKDDDDDEPDSQPKTNVQQPKPKPGVSREKVVDIVNGILSTKEKEIVEKAIEGARALVGEWKLSLEDTWRELYPVLCKMWKAGKLRAKIEMLNEILGKNSIKIDKKTIAV